MGDSTEGGSVVPVAAQVCQSKGHDSDTERFVTVLSVSNPDADKHSSSGNNGLRDLQPEDYDHEQEICENRENKTASATHLQVETFTLSRESGEEVQSGNQLNEFHSLDLTDTNSQYLEGRDDEVLSFGDVRQTDPASLPTGVENAEKDLVLVHGNNEAEDAGNTPVTVSESGNDDDNNPESNLNQLPSTPDDNANSTMLMASPFTTATKGYREVPTATVIYSNSEMSCFRKNEELLLSKELELCCRLKKGWNGEVYTCRLRKYRGNKQLICKIERKSLLCEKKEFSKLCQLKSQYSLPILAYICERHNSSGNGYVGYLIMEYLPNGDICKIVDYLKDQLSKANKKLKNIENIMDSANPRVWNSCQGSWQNQRSMILRYQSGLVKMIYGAIQSVNQFHKYGLLHLDIKESNFLIRKQCEHKDEFDCDCSNVIFDVVLTDYDYVHEEGSEIKDPTHTGTLQYRALPLRFACDPVKAEHHFDYYSLCVMIISIICGNKWCKEKLGKWKKQIKEAKMKYDDTKTAEEIGELATLSLLGEVRYVACSLFGQKHEDIFTYVENKLQECIKRFCSTVMNSSVLQQ